jgi:hypothetical protein
MWKKPRAESGRKKSNWDYTRVRQKRWQALLLKGEKLRSPCGLPALLPLDKDPQIVHKGLDKAKNLIHDTKHNPPKFIENSEFVTFYCYDLQPIM